MSLTNGGRGTRVRAVSVGVRHRGEKFGLERLGLVAVLVTFVVSALNFAFQTQAFTGPDESPHLGYAHSIAGGELPRIDDPADVPVEATEWSEHVAQANSVELQSVWVANHPPLFYMAVAPLVWLSDGLDRGDGGLMFVRLANVVFATIGLLMTYALAMIVTGGARQTALAATAIAAFLPLVHFTFGAGINDGLGFLASTGLLVAAARIVTRPPASRQRTDLIVLGAVAAVAAGTRASTMFLAVLVIAFVAVHQALRSGADRAAALRRSATIAGAGIGPGLVLFGWFYVRNVRLYGDLTGSSFLFDYFDFREGDGLLGVLSDGSVWTEVYFRLTSTASPGEPYQTVPFVVAVGFGAVALVGLVLVAARWFSVSASVPMPGVALCALATGAVAGMLAVHAAGGGSPHARYLMPALGAGSTLVAIGLNRVWPGVLPAAAAMTTCLWSAHFLPAQVRKVDGPFFLANPELRGVGGATLGVIGTGAAVLAMGVLLYLAGTARRSTAVAGASPASSSRIGCRSDTVGP